MLWENVYKHAQTKLVGISGVWKKKFENGAGKRKKKRKTGRRRE